MDSQNYNSIVSMHNNKEVLDKVEENLRVQREVSNQSSNDEQTHK